MRRSAGFTLIELLVVIGIIGLLAAALLPNVLGASVAGNIAADKANLDWHYKELLRFKNRGSSWPKEGGCNLVLAPWVSGQIEKTPENRDRYFTPGLDDPVVDGLRLEDVTQLWTNYGEVNSESTHYAGRARDHLRGNWWGKNAEPVMSNDNEFGSAFADGTVNILMAGGAVRTLYRQNENELKQYWDDDDPDFYIEVGSSSPVPELQKLSAR